MMCLMQLINFVWAITYSNYNERLRDYALELMHPLRGPKSCSFLQTPRTNAPTEFCAGHVLQHCFEKTNKQTKKLPLPNDTYFQKEYTL